MWNTILAINSAIGAAMFVFTVYSLGTALFLGAPWDRFWIGFSLCVVLIITEIALAMKS